MEYFLYGVSEAYRIVEELKVMEAKINLLIDEVDLRKKDSGYGDQQQQ